MKTLCRRRQNRITCKPLPGYCWRYLPWSPSDISSWEKDINYNCFGTPLPSIGRLILRHPKIPWASNKYPRRRGRDYPRWPTGIWWIPHEMVRIWVRIVRPPIFDWSEFPLLRSGDFTPIIWILKFGAQGKREYQYPVNWNLEVIEE